MAPQLFVVHLRKARVPVRIGEREVAALGLSGFSIHGILGGDGVELVGTLDDVLLDGVVADG